MKNQNISYILKMVPLAAKMQGDVFAKAFYKNIRKLEDKLQAINKIKEPSNSYQILRQSINDIHSKYADRQGADGTPKTKVEELPNGEKIERYVCTIASNIEKRDNEVAEIERLNPEVFKEQKEKVEKFLEEMNKECDIKFDIVEEKDFPTNITPEVMFSFDWMLKFKS